MTPIINKGRLISLKFHNAKHKMSLEFLDSYQLLPSSLKKLAESFGTLTQKGSFPHKFIDKNNLNYIGPVPLAQYYDLQFKLDEYKLIQDSYPHNYFDLRKEAISYCVDDCISLHQILTKFNKMIFNKFNLNILKYPTITSLTFAIFRSAFMKEEQIPMISGQIFNDIKLSYTGL